jgi:hypothetical protein
MELDQVYDSQPCSSMSFISMEDVLPGHGGKFGLGGFSLSGKNSLRLEMQFIGHYSS